MAAWESGRTESVIALRDVAAAIPVSTPDEESAAAFVEALTSFSDHDYDRAVPAFARAAETGAESSDVSTLLMASWGYAFLGRQDEGLVVARRGERIARSSGAVAALASLLGPIAGWSVGSSQFAAAEAAAAEGVELARETGQTAQVAHCMAFLAYIAGVRGREEACRTYARETIELAHTHELLLAGSTAEAAMGFLDLGAGRYEEALTRFRTQRATGHPTARFAFVDELVEAAVRAGRPDDALEPLGEWERFIGGRGLLVGDVVLARGRAMLARPEDADEAFQAVLAMDAGGAWPFYQARTELAYGEFLRRARRRTEARVQLRAAVEGFRRLGAEAWAARAASELRATGETARRRDASTLDQLTPQELQIAKLVAEGGRNREIAGQLFLSPKTVEYHLRKVFQKLDISSRTELVKLVAGGRELVAAP
jgi:DNA-binding NarL/FixJ family response regulator